MPPRKWSRHMFALGVQDEDGNVHLTERVPFHFKEFPDNRHHVVKAGETLWHLAGMFFAGFERPSGLWWVIADFQPTPIHDPTLKLKPGITLVIPSLRTLDEEVFSERRRAETSG